MSTGSRFLTLIGLALLTCSLGGCGTINANLAAGISDGSVAGRPFFLGI